LPAVALVTLEWSSLRWSRRHSVYSPEPGHSHMQPYKPEFCIVEQTIVPTVSVHHMAVDAVIYYRPWDHDLNALAR